MVVLFTQMKVPRFLKTIITSSFYCYIETLLTHVWAVTMEVDNDFDYF